MRIYDFEEQQITNEIAQITTIKEGIEESIVLVIFKDNSWRTYTYNGKFISAKITRNARFVNIDKDASVDAGLAVRYLYQCMNKKPDGVVRFSESLRFAVSDNGSVYPLNLDEGLEDIPEQYFDDWKED